ncbi:hypothetical protein LINPERHAP1_LOCUS6278 [Linum perenne]
MTQSPSSQASMPPPPPRQAPTVPPTSQTSSQPVLVPPPPFQEEWDECLGVLTDVSGKRSECWTNWIAFTDPQRVKRAKSANSSSQNVREYEDDLAELEDVVVACATNMDSNEEVTGTTSEAGNEDGYDSENDEDFVRTSGNIRSVFFGEFKNIRNLSS